MDSIENLERAPVGRLGEAQLDSPLLDPQNEASGAFVGDDAWVRYNIDVGGQRPPAGREPLLFERAGPRPKLFFDPARTKAAIVTCGGLCPGLNNVIRSAFMELHFRYGVQEIYGIRNGYRGLNPAEGEPPFKLNRDFIGSIHTEGGTMLGTSRGPQKVSTMVDFLHDRGINILLCVGGDGTQRGAHEICQEARRRSMPLAVVGVPKTIDNDVAYCDRTFGFTTAVEKGAEVIHLAHTEARSAVRGIGLVKLMGREAGFIAAAASLVAQEVNFCLIPEIPFALEGPGGFLAALDRRMEDRGHAVVVVAEGAGQHLFDREEAYDASGNKRFGDIGLHLKKVIVDYFKKQKQDPVDLKYIDPSYIIRSVPADVEDAWLCDRLARNAVHAAMSGRTDLVVSFINNRMVYVPIERVIQQKRRMELDGELWSSVLACTGQPAVLE